MCGDKKQQNYQIPPKTKIYLNTKKSEKPPLVTGVINRSTIMKTNHCPYQTSCAEKKTTTTASLHYLGQPKVDELHHKRLIRRLQHDILHLTPQRDTTAEQQQSSSSSSAPSSSFKNKGHGCVVCKLHSHRVTSVHVPNMNTLE